MGTRTTEGGWWARRDLLARAEKAERERDEAREDTARLDWIDSQFSEQRDPIFWIENALGRYGDDSVARTIREAIDAARESGGEAEG